jgi:hypothetical protein
MGVASVWMRREVRKNWAETEGQGGNSFGDVVVRVELGVLDDDDDDEEEEEEVGREDKSSSMSKERN